MKNLLVSLFIFSCSSLFAQVPYWSWSHTFGGYHYDVGSAIANDHNGNLVACGYYYDDTIFVGNQTLLNNGADDFYVAKYDVSGNLVWVRHAGGSTDDVAASVSADLAGNIYVVGYFGSDSLIIGTDTLINYSGSGGYLDMFVAKYDPSGNVLWAKKFGGGSWDLAQSVAVDVNSGNVYIAGCYYDSTITVGSYVFPNAGAYDILLIKMDPNGNLLWAVNSGGSSNDMGNAVAVDNNGNAFISGGYMSALIPFGAGNLTNNFPGIPDIFVAKFDPNGINLWSRRAGSNDNDHSVCVATDPSGDCFVSGHFHSTSFPFAGDSVYNAGMGDVYLLKYDAAGNEIWGRSAGGMMHDFGYGVTADAAGNSYIAGMFNSDTMMVGVDMLINHSSNQDMFLIKYDPFGSVSWSLSAGGNGDDEIDALAMGDFQDVYVTGDWRSSTIALGSQNYVNTDSITGYADIFVGDIDNWLGVNEAITENEGVAIYPNPSNGIFRISSTQSIDHLEIYNAEGELIKTLNNIVSNSPIDLSDKAAGIYFFRAHTGENISSGTFILRK